MARHRSNQEDSRRISYKEYWDEITKLAEAAADQVVDDDEDIDEAAQKQVAQHEWVIYTNFNFDVLRYTDGDGAINEVVMGMVEPGRDWFDLLSEATMVAMWSDVSERAQRIWAESDYEE